MLNMTLRAIYCILYTIYCILLHVTVLLHLVMPKMTRAPKTIANPPFHVQELHLSSLGRYVFGSEISYNKAPPRLPGLGC